MIYFKWGVFPLCVWYQKKNLFDVVTENQRDLP